VDTQPVATVDLPGTAAAAQSPVASQVRDMSMRVLEAALGLGALATALLLGLAR
jgi:hypothetical protein